MSERILIVAPSWIGDAILSEPLLAILREPLQEPTVDVLAPPWCAPVYARMRGVRHIIENPVGHRELRFGERRALARALRGDGYTRALVLPNSFKSALIPWLARIPRRVGLDLLVDPLDQVVDQQRVLLARGDLLAFARDHAVKDVVVGVEAVAAVGVDVLDHQPAKLGLF